MAEAGLANRYKQMQMLQSQLKDMKKRHKDEISVLKAAYDDLREDMIDDLVNNNQTKAVFQATAPDDHGIEKPVEIVASIREKEHTPKPTEAQKAEALIQVIGDKTKALEVWNTINAVPQGSETEVKTSLVLKKRKIREEKAGKGPKGKKSKKQKAVDVFKV